MVCYNCVLNGDGEPARVGERTRCSRITGPTCGGKLDSPGGVKHFCCRSYHVFVFMWGFYFDALSHSLESGGFMATGIFWVGWISLVILIPYCGRIAALPRVYVISPSLIPNVLQHTLVIVNQHE